MHLIILNPPISSSIPRNNMPHRPNPNTHPNPWHTHTNSHTDTYTSHIHSPHRIIPPQPLMLPNSMPLMVMNVLLVIMVNVSNCITHLLLGLLEEHF
jgi:hypothetical protein